jgi:glycosyltransferase involved in cell wall biosynthesis
LTFTPAPLISVILPVFNGEKYLTRAIQSILGQTLTKIELIILNDASDDNTRFLIEQYLNLDKRIRCYENDSNIGLSLTLNRGQELSRGKFITWTSHDNILMPNALENMLHELVNTNSDFVYADCLVVNEKGEEIGFLKAKPIENILFSNVVHACFLYRREVYKNVGEYDSDLKLIEDWDYWLRCAQKCKMTNISQTLYQFRHHDASLTAQIKTERLKKKLFENNKYKMLENLVSDKRIRNKELVIEFFLNTDQTIFSVLSNGIFPIFINEIKYVIELFPALSSRRVRYVIANRIYDFLVNKPEYHDLRLINLITTSGFLINSLPPVRTAVLFKKAFLR